MFIRREAPLAELVGYKSGIGKILTSIGMIMDLSNRGVIEDSVYQSTIQVQVGSDKATRAVLAIATGMGERLGARASLLARDEVKSKLMPFLSIGHPIDGGMVDYGLRSVFAEAQASLTLEHNNKNLTDKVGTGLTTTLTVAVINNGFLHVASRGDEAVYIIRGGALHRVTRVNAAGPALRLQTSSAASPSSRLAR